MTKSEKEKYELIEKFIENTLSEEEQALFNATLKNDPGFALEVEVHKEVHGLLLDQGILTVKEKLQKIHRAETNGGNYKLYASIAAIVLTAGTLLYFYNSSKTNEVKVKEPVSQTTSVTPSSQNEDKGLALTDTKQKSTPITDNSNKNSSNITTQKTTIPNPSVQDGQTSSDNKPSLKDIPVTTSDDKDPVPTDTKTPSGSQTDNPAPKPTVVDCSSIKITGNGDVKESCKDENTGSIVVHLNSIKGGKAPYKFSVTSEDDFTTASYFDQLEAGTYMLQAKDANGCVSDLKEFTVESKDCPKNSNKFWPLEGETWPIPLKNNADAKLQIFNRAGVMVYSIYISNGYPNTWNGTDNSGQLLPAGLYVYRIIYNDQSIINGDVSLNKR